MSKPIDKSKPQRDASARPYTRPVLTRFGKVRELTAGGTGAMTEGGMGGMGDMGGMGMGQDDPNRRP